MTINVSVGSGEITGFAEIKDVNITFEFAAEETGAVVKQFLPAIREFKEFGIFQTKTENGRLAEKLNESREENRENRQAKDSAELEASRLKAKVNELEGQLKEARTLATKLNK